MWNSQTTRHEDSLFQGFLGINKGQTHGCGTV